MGLNEMIRRGAGSALAEIEKLDEFIERNPRASLRKFKKWAMEERLSLPLFEKVLALSFVGERGAMLSGGQKQRIAIARTLLKDNNILIFDDSLSAVDTETDAQIRAALRHEQKDVTTLIISHRVTTLSQADLILVLENGQITQQGTHAELCSQPGLYQRINSIQNKSSLFRHSCRDG